MMDEILKHATQNTIDELKSNEVSSDVFLVAIFVLSIYTKEIKELLEEENKNDNSSKN